MKTLTLALVVAVVCSAPELSHAESWLSKITLSPEIGILTMTGEGKAFPATWDSTTRTIPFHLANEVGPSLVRELPATQLGLGWDSTVLPVFALTLGLRSSDRLHVGIRGEWANQTQDTDRMAVYAPGDSAEDYYFFEYVEYNHWKQSGIGLVFHYAPFAIRPNLYLIGNLSYHWFRVEIGYYSESWTNDEYTFTATDYSDQGELFSYSGGFGFTFLRKPASREGYLECTWSWMRYGSASTASDGASLFGRRVEIDLGGFRLQSGIRFHVRSLFQG